MIRNLLATTAIATLIATGAMAQAPAGGTMGGGTMTTEPAAPAVKQADGHLASNIIGESVYNGTGDDAENIGSVSDIVINADNSIEALVVGVGGFLGLGQKLVALEFDLFEWAERDGDEYLVIATSADALRAQPDFDPRAYELSTAEDVSQVTPASREDLASAPANPDAAAPADGAPAAGGTTAMAPAPTAAPETTAQAPAAETPAAGTDATETAAIDRSTLTERPVGQISADDFVGTTVYGTDEENVGSIGDVILSDAGQVDAVIVDVGGFLGMGAKPVAIGMENLSFMADEDGDLYLYTSFTRDQLEAQPEYDEATFAENRDTMIMRNQVQ